MSDINLLKIIAYAVLTKTFLIKTNIKIYLLIFMCYNISTGLFDTKI